MSSDRYLPAPGLALEVTGPALARAHFRAEYGAARTDDPVAPDVVVEVAFAGRLPAGVPQDGHKTVRWAVEVDPPDARPLRVRLTVAGRPRRFALSMVQGYVVEPLVSVAAARAGLVLLPAAALAEDGGAVVVLGRSRSGKTSVVARTVAEGRSALGDDQVVVDGEGRVRSWPRRLRVYSDLRLTAPSAVAALPGRDRLALHVMRWVKAASGGRVAPSRPLAYAALGGVAAPGPLRVTRVVVVERGGGGDGVVTAALGTREVAGLARTVLEEQRARLLRVTGPAWADAVRDAAEREDRVLRTALDGLPAQRWTVPDGWGAARAVGELAAALGARPGV